MCFSRNISSQASSIPLVKLMLCNNDDCSGDTTPEDASSGFRKPHHFLVFIEDNNFCYEDLENI